MSTSSLRITLSSKAEACVTLGNNTLTWNVFPYFKSNVGLSYDPFEQINDYMAVLPKEVNEHVFVSLQAIQTTLNTHTTRTLDAALEKDVAHLFSRLDINHVKQWIDLRANIVIPEEVESQYKENEQNTGNRDRTYIKEDYCWLIAMCVLLRLMMPVWGEYIVRTSREKGNVYKEYFAAQLLNKSNLNTCEPMQKLKLFVVESIPKDKSMISSIMAAFSEEDFPLWPLRLVIVRKLCIDDIRGTSTDSHLIKVLFQFIKHRIRTLEASFYGIIKEKFSTQTDTGDDSNNLSKIEGYKIRQEIASGDVAILRQSISNPYIVAQKLSPGMTNKMIDESLRAIKLFEYLPISQEQKLIIQSVYKPVVSQYAIHLENKKELVRHMAVSIAVLWRAGWYELAALLSATKEEESDYIQIAHTAVRAQMTRVQQERLEILYPYKRRPQGKQRIAKNQNIAINTIKNLNEHFISNKWIVNIPKVWLDKTPNITYRIPHTADPSLRIILADYLIALASHPLPLSLPKEQIVVY